MHSNASPKYRGFSNTGTTLLAIGGAFITYCSMYAFRKPFTAAAYDSESLWGIDLKIVLITAQAIGYMLSKFIGIKVVSELPPARRVLTICLLMSIAGVSLLLFGLSAPPYRVIWIFLNGLPLGMMWGVVFSFLEGRKNTELLGAGMSASFIVSSGLVKSVGRHLLDSWQVAPYWMPLLTALLFVPLLALGVWMLTRIPPPTAEDVVLRTARVPMHSKQRRHFFTTFAFGIIAVVIIYIALTIFRDLRDNFAVEIWTQLGYPNVAQLLLTAEIPIAIAVFGIVALMIYIRNNKTAFFANIVIIMLGGLFLMAATFLFQQKIISPAHWMIMAGFAVYLSYISYHTMLFERWIAVFRYPGNIGFLMYIADSFGYMGSVGILFYKNSGSKGMSWLDYMINISYVVGLITFVLSLMAWWYFQRKVKRSI